MSKLTLGLVVALATAPAFAQSTSAGVGGLVTNPSGQPAAGVEVTIVHVESGTVSRVTTDGSGRFNARGLRVGGPYTLTFKSADGVRTEDGVYLNLNQVNTVNAALLPDVTTLETVTAIGVAGGSEVFSATNMGTGTNVTRQTIDAMPSIGRNIQDFMRMDPRVSQVSKADGGITAGGQNTRYNAIRIDGVSTNDPFGLESNNLPTERQPVSLDAIEEVKIDLANYDVTTTGGTGAVVNAVTRSGTNEFHGSLYGVYRSNDMVGDDQNGNPFTGFNKEETFGATFGGPIVKDKLFFFANYEKFKRGAPGPDLVNTPYGRGQITDANIAAIQAAAKTWGFDAGSLVGAEAADTDIEEYAVKLDWNINDSHRASVRYSKMSQDVAKLPPSSWSSAISLSSHWYNQNKTFESTVAQVFSDWTEDFSTEIKISQRKYDAVAQPSSHLPHMRVDFGNQTVHFGTEQNRHVNVVNTDETSVFAAGTWFKGDHAFKFGIDYASNDIFNYYGRNQNGFYRFANLQDFIAGTPLEYAYRKPLPGASYDDIPAQFTIKNTGFFLQDTWSVNYNLSLLFGLRADKPSFGSTPTYNPCLSSAPNLAGTGATGCAYGGFGYDNTATIDGVLWQPRIGFNYTFDGDRQSQLRGGVGLFMGAAPNVWLSGAYQNTGMAYAEYSCSGTGSNRCRTGMFNPDPDKQPVVGAAARQNIDIMHPDLKQPSVWKANLAFDQELPWQGLVLSAELLLTKVKDGITMDRLDLGAANPVVGPDGRVMYWNAAGLNPVAWGTSLSSPSGGTQRYNRPNYVGDAILVRNTDVKGSSEQFTISLEKPMAENWSWLAAYTFTTAKEVNPLTSSQNTSNWNNNFVFNANEDRLENSRYAIRDRFTGAVTWQKALFGDNKTTVSMFYEGRSGRPFSYVFWNDANGDSRTFNDLFYVPTGPGDVVFKNPAEETAFFQWLSAHPELARFAGQVAPANAFRAGWVNSFDVRVNQDFPGFMKGHKSSLSLDVMNIGNLLNKKWGLIKDAGFNSNLAVANFSGICNAAAIASGICPAGSAGKYVYRFTGAQDVSIQEVNGDGVNTGVSRWSAQLTLRYSF
ncbi:MAG: TonB-dependent receptor [Proteobacteria bacterium]|nr:TonB-dependent receptor [Pseudomonadota bacterium]